VKFPEVKIAVKSSLPYYDSAGVGVDIFGLLLASGPRCGYNCAPSTRRGALSFSNPGDIDEEPILFVAGLRGAVAALADQRFCAAVARENGRV
jgi:hypothetical protein